jgi:LSD1 subclass zinc finger protein
MPEPQVRKVACPSCGAPLLFGPGEITTRCPFCHAVVERPLRADQPATVKSGPADSRPSHPSTGSSPVNPISIFAFLALGLGAVVAVGIIVMAIVFSENGPSSGSRLIFNGPIVTLPTDRTEGPDFIAFAYDISAETNLFLRVDPVAGKVVWRGKKIEDSSNLQELVLGDARFFTAEGSELHAYRSADGVELWQARLSDKLGYCEGCLSAEGNRVVALTQDYVIEAFDAETGASAWKRRMDGYTSGFTIADGGLWVIDKADGEFSLLFLSLADGSVVRRITPDCPSKDGFGGSRLDSAAMFLLDPAPSVRSADRSIYLMYGFFPGCVERWDAATATRIWQVEEDRGFSPSRDFATLFTQDTFYFAYEKTLWSAAKADGRFRTVADGGDYDLVPLALEQDVLILRTKRTRGTTQFGLRGFDPAAGTILWDHPIENSAPYDPPDAAFRDVDEDQAIWTWRISGGLLHLYVFQANPNQLTFPTLDPKTGTLSAGETLAFSFDSDSYFGPEILYWKDSIVWIMVDSRLMAVDTAAAAVKYHFP